MSISLKQALADRSVDRAEAFLAENPAWRPGTEGELAELGNQFTRLGVFTPSETIARRYLAHDPTSLTALQLLLTALVQASRFDPARPIAEEILGRDPENLLALSSLGVIEQVAGDVERAITLYKQALDIAPGYETALRNLTYLLTTMGRRGELSMYDGGLINWRSPLFLDRPRYRLSLNPGVAAAAETLLEQGLCVLPGMIRPEFVAQMRQSFFVEGGGGALAQSIGVETLLAAPLIQCCQVLGVPFAVESALTEPLQEILIEAFGQEPTLDPQLSVLRLVGSDREGSHVPFHQDMRAFGKIGVNVWAPMTPAGGDHPGLELIPGRLAKLLPTMATPGEYDYLNIDLGAAEGDVELSRAVAPVLNPGDCILFIGDVVHRSYIPPKVSDHGATERLSIEMRFFA